MNIDEIRTYSNPFELTGEWPDYGIGDPFVLRHNGTYYLYVSTKDGRIGIKAWRSIDLVNWTYEGLGTEDERIISAYAPEVVYWNGTFYMYTSPAGNGHYVLSSKSPTGPFKVETENLGMSIDGSVFIDDDGSWYFTHAGHNGIVGRRMKDPYTFEEGIETNLFLNHWTEGSQIIKNNGRYYMTYTGNHVFSKGYRINYAVSEESPLTGYEVPAHNPILISTREEFNGLGHNSLVRGPNLDSYYIVYHNLIGRSAEGPPVRKMNIDRLIFNGKKLDVLGPTNYPTPVPELPDYEKRWDETEKFNQTWLSESETAENYTVEFNFKIIEQSNYTEFATIFSYHDHQNYGAVTLDINKSKVKLLKVKDGIRKTIGEANFPDEFDFSYLHTIRIENNNNGTVVFLDEMKKITVNNTGFGVGLIGYLVENAKITFGYTAFSNHVNHSSDYELYKPLPGTIESVHYLEGENRGFYVKKPSDNKILREKVPLKLREDGSYAVILNEKGDWLKYKINVKETGLYEVSAVINPNSVKQPVHLGIAINDGKSSLFKVRKNIGDSEESFLKVRLGRINLDEGFHVLNLFLDKGEVILDHLEFYRVTDEKLHIENGLEFVEKNDIYGSWKQCEQGILANKAEDMKIYLGDEKWTDLDVELTFKMNDQLMDEAGLLLRVNNESDFEHQVKDSLQGYYVSFNTRELSLRKLNYDSTLLDSISVSLEEDKEYLLRVKVQENNITVFLDYEKNPILTYKDPAAIMSGKLGIRSEYSDVLFKRIKIKSLALN